jgi:hypothetical protein
MRCEFVYELFQSAVELTWQTLNMENENLFRFESREVIELRDAIGILSSVILLLLDAICLGLFYGK